MSTAIKDKLIVALDVDSRARALDLVDELREHVGMFKVGMQLFTASGPDMVRSIISLGARVFLDLKYHDIPNTVAAAGVEAARLGVFMFNVHALGGSDMMKSAAEAVGEASEKEGLDRPRVIAVTLLTSVDRTTVREIGMDVEPAAAVDRLARLADDSGMDGVVASPLEVEIIRSAVSNRDFLVVTPGVRPTGSSTADQKRVMTPADAVRAGADYLVVGRPILDASDRICAAQAVCKEMALAVHSE